MLPRETQTLRPFKIIWSVPPWRRVLATSLALLVMTAAPARAFDLPVPTDKVAHLSLSYLMCDQLIRLGAGREQALAITLALGLFKEVTDQPFDPLDMAANVAGALAAAYLRYDAPGPGPAEQAEAPALRLRYTF